MQPSSLKVRYDVKIGRKDIKIQQKLANGAFGVVYKVVIVVIIIIIIIILFI